MKQSKDFFCQDCEVYLNTQDMQIHYDVTYDKELGQGHNIRSIYSDE